MGGEGRLNLGRIRETALGGRKRWEGFLMRLKVSRVDSSLAAGFIVEKWARVMEINRRDNWYEEKLETDFRKTL